MKRRAKAMASDYGPVGNTSRHTRIIPIPKTKIKLDKPLIIVGFPDNGFVGSICISYIVEKLAMHQIASVESDYVMPAALFIGRKFRHPFRIYANNSGKVCAIICEVPVMMGGVTSLTNVVLDWASDLFSPGLIVVGSIVGGNFSPSFHDGRKALLLQNILSEDDPVFSEQPLQSEKLALREDEERMAVPESAIVPGLAGSLLSSCATKGISCSAILVPSLGDIPDPEGAAIVLDSLNEIFPELAIDTSTLRKQGEAIKKRLDEFAKMHQRQIREYEEATRRPSAEGIYK